MLGQLLVGLILCSQAGRCFKGILLLGLSSIRPFITLSVRSRTVRDKILNFKILK